MYSEYNTESKMLGATAATGSAVPLLVALALAFTSFAVPANVKAAFFLVVMLHNNPIRLDYFQYTTQQLHAAVVA